MVGVVIPYHNDLAQLEECLRSLEGQYGLSYVVIVDDGSDIPLLKPDFPSFQIKILRLWENKGVQRARNYGWWWLRTQYVHLPFIVFCDQDVQWKKRAFLHLYEALEVSHRLDSKVAYSYGNYERWGVVKGDWVAGEFDEKRLKEVNYISTMSMVYTKTLPNPPFVEDEERLQDWSLWLRMLKVGRTGVYVNSTVFSTFYKAGCISVRDDSDYWKWSSIMRQRYVVNNA